MTEEICPVCKGTRKAISQYRYNGVVDPQKPSQETVCWFCDGSGIVHKANTNHMLIHKYYLAGGINGEEIQSEG